MRLPQIRPQLQPALPRILQLRPRRQLQGLHPEHCPLECRDKIRKHSWAWLLGEADCVLGNFLLPFTICRFLFVDFTFMEFHPPVHCHQPWRPGCFGWSYSSCPWSYAWRPYAWGGGVPPTRSFPTAKCHARSHGRADANDTDVNDGWWTWCSRRIWHARCWAARRTTTRCTSIPWAWGSPSLPRSHWWKWACSRRTYLPRSDWRWKHGDDESRTTTTTRSGLWLHGQGSRLWKRWDVPPSGSIELGERQVEWWQRIWWQRIWRW